MEWSRTALRRSYRSCSALWPHADLFHASGPAAGSENSLSFREALLLISPAQMFQRRENPSPCTATFQQQFPAPAVLHENCRGICTGKQPEQYYSFEILPSHRLPAWSSPTAEIKKRKQQER